MVNRERRHALRITPDPGSITHVRVKPGIDVLLLNLSPGGVLLETTVRLLPGALLELLLAECGGPTRALRGRVVRCSVSTLLPGEVRYRGAVQFDRDEPWLARRDRTRPDVGRFGNGTDQVWESDTHAEAPSGVQRAPPPSKAERGMSDPVGIRFGCRAAGIEETST
jgi:hypothetical protein